MFFDRLNELMNPIEKERLKVDSVSSIKNVVKTFYQTKQMQCQQLLESLDLMNHERRQIMDMKKKKSDNPERVQQPVINAEGQIVQFEMPHNLHVAARVSDVRTNVQINRIRKFKNVAAKSIWY